MQRMISPTVCGSPCPRAPAEGADAAGDVARRDEFGCVGVDEVAEGLGGQRVLFEIVVAVLLPLAAVLAAGLLDHPEADDVFEEFRTVYP